MPRASLFPSSPAPATAERPGPHSLRAGLSHRGMLLHPFSVWKTLLNSVPFQWLS